MYVYSVEHEVEQVYLLKWWRLENGYTEMSWVPLTTVAATTKRITFPTGGMRFAIMPHARTVRTERILFLTPNVQVLFGVILHTL